ncbi:MAG: 5'-methylthioadenosine/adenosylhomocysteine nucleosidase [Clostridia bacterium]|nr:5'-methylthioadenosine/adenosylhomocysteine nucleosidase [Clostridia bacterium]MBR4014506.1 5'-methylthioadenosine/adenosylhomocysteine nucleosidase [Clostridia bacterium]
MKIGIIGAMSVEVDALKAQIKDLRTTTVSGIEFFEGVLFGKDVVVARCGIGKVFAAICAQSMILRFGVTHVINTGVGGTLTDRLNILDVAVADGVVQHDMDTSPIGDPVGLISGINKVVLPTSKVLCDAALKAADKLCINAVSGIIASGDQFISSKERKQFIASTFAAICCEMEGAAIGHVCYVNGVECLIVRAISDSATGDAEMEYPEMVARAAAQSQKMIEEIIYNL